MAERTESQVTIDAEPAQVLDVIGNFPAYPAWASEITAVRVLSQHEDGRAEQVEFTVDAGVVKDTYVLEYGWDLAEDHTGEVRWHLVSSRALKALEGAYLLRAAGGATQVTYRLAMDLAVRLPGIVRRRGERALVDTALKGLKKRVESGE